MTVNMTRLVAPISVNISHMCKVWHAIADKIGMGGVEISILQEKFGVEKSNEVGKLKNDMVKFFLFLCANKIVWSMMDAIFLLNVMYGILFFVKYQKGKKLFVHLLWLIELAKFREINYLSICNGLC